MDEKIKNIFDKIKADPELSKKFQEELTKLKESKAASSEMELIC